MNADQDRNGICTSPIQDIENQLDSNTTNVENINKQIINMDRLIEQFNVIISKWTGTIDDALKRNMTNNDMTIISKKIKKKLDDQRIVCTLKTELNKLDNLKKLLTSYSELDKNMKELTSNNKDYNEDYKQIQQYYTNIIDGYTKNYTNYTSNALIDQTLNQLTQLQLLINKYTENTIPVPEEEARKLSQHLEDITIGSTMLIKNLSNSPESNDNKMHCEIENLYYVLVDLYHKYELLSDDEQKKTYWQQIVTKITEYKRLLDDIKGFQCAEDDNITFGGKKKKGRKTKRRKTKRRKKTVNQKTKKVKRVKRANKHKTKRIRKRTVGGTRNSKSSKSSKSSNYIKQEQKMLKPYTHINPFSSKKSGTNLMLVSPPNALGSYSLPSPLNDTIVGPERTVPIFSEKNQPFNNQ